MISPTDTGRMGCLACLCDSVSLPAPMCSISTNSSGSLGASPSASGMSRSSGASSGAVGSNTVDAYPSRSASSITMFRIRLNSFWRETGEPEREVLLIGPEHFFPELVPQFVCPRHALILLPAPPRSHPPPISAALSGSRTAFYRIGSSAFRPDAP